VNRLRRAGAILLLAVLCAPAAAGTGLERLRAFLDGLDTLRAEFRQVLVDERGEALEEAAGSVLLARPGRFRWDYVEPYRQLIVADGQQLWLYDPDLAQVTVRPQAGALDATPASLLASRRPVDEVFVIEELGVDAEGVAWLALEPREAGSSFESIRVGLNAGGGLRMRLVDGFGQTTDLAFLDVQRNPSVAEERFRFTPPEGVDVIRGQ
jgi:outer membrane lipoprotein carrier protein